MTERELSILITAYEEGSFLAASRKLFVSQSALSQSIRKLEQQLGTALFVKSGNHVKPTNICSRIVTEGRPLLAQWNTFQNNIEHALKEAQSDLNIMAPSGFLFCTLLPLANQFEQQYPDLHIHFSEKLKTDVYSHLEKHPGDLGFVFETRPRKDFVMIPAVKVRYYLAVPNSHPFALAHPFRGFGHMETVDLKDFKDEFFAVPSADYSAYNAFMRMFREAGFEPKTAVESIYPSNIREYVNSGRALTLINSYVANYRFPKENISYYDLDLPGSERTIYACLSKEVPVSPYIEEFIKKVTAYQMIYSD